MSLNDYLNVERSAAKVQAAREAFRDSGLTYGQLAPIVTVSREAGSHAQAMEVVTGMSMVYDDDDPSPANWTVESSLASMKDSARQALQWAKDNPNTFWLIVTTVVLLAGGVGMKMKMDADARAARESETTWVGKALMAMLAAIAGAASLENLTGKNATAWLLSLASWATGKEITIADGSGSQAARDLISAAMPTGQGITRSEARRIEPTITPLPNLTLSSRFSLPGGARANSLSFDADEATTRIVTDFLSAGEPAVRITEINQGPTSVAPFRVQWADELEPK